MEDRVGAPGAAGLCSDFDAGSIQVKSDSGSHTALLVANCRSPFQEEHSEHTTNTNEGNSVIKSNRMKCVIYLGHNIYLNVSAGIIFNFKVLQ